MNIVKYIKHRILFFFAILLIFFPFCFTKQEDNKVMAGDNASTDNAYLACFIDDGSCMYKTQVIYSGSYIEAYRISRLLHLGNKEGMELKSADVSNYVWGNQSSLFLHSANERLSIYRFRNSINSGDTVVNPPLFNTLSGNEQVQVALNIDDSNGRFKLSARYGQDYYEPGLGVDTGNSDLNAPISSIKWNEHAIYMPRPMTFPSSQRGATEADINRAYEIQALLSDDFRDALLFINDSQAYTNVDTLIETAYSVVTSADEGKIRNQYGTTYVIDFGDGTNGGYIDEDSNGYLHYVLISKLEGGKKVNTTRFNYKVKKGYVNCIDFEPMENGAKNSLDNSLYNEATDTTYISWEHFFVEAGILYAQGVSYANQGDLFNIDSLQSSLVVLCRDTLISVKGLLELYSMEDCIFNTGIRGSSAFVHGVYYSNWGYYVSLFFMIFVSIALALIVISMIKIIINKQLGTISPSARYSMAEGIKNLIISLFVMSSIWILIKFILLLNGRYVDIWGAYIGSRTLTDVSAGYSTLASILYQLTYFIIQIYVNYVYILRSLIVPALIITSPVFIIAYSFGEGGKRITTQWIKEFLGNVFLQSIHATVYGLILVMSTSLRGIEGIVLCSAFIPLTAIYKSILQIGGDEVLKKAQSLTAQTSAGMGVVASAGANMVGGAIKGVSGVAGGITTAVTGNPLAGSLVSGAGSLASDTMSGLGSVPNLGLGAGLGIATGDHQGTIMISQGASGISGAVSRSGDTISRLSSDAGKQMAPVVQEKMDSHRTNKVINQAGINHLGKAESRESNKETGNHTLNYKTESFSDLNKYDKNSSHRREGLAKLELRKEAIKAQKGGEETRNAFMQKYNLRDFKILTEKNDGMNGISLTYNQKTLDAISKPERPKKGDGSGSWIERMNQIRSQASKIE